MTYQEQVLANTKNIAKIINEAKKIKGFTELTTGVNQDDCIPLQRGNETLYIKMSALPFASIFDIYGLNALIKGGYHNVAGTYDFYIWVKEYIINGNYTDFYRSATRTPEQADDTWDRFDAAVINTAGEIFIRKGTAGEFFIEPEIDTLTELKIALIYIKANSVIPENINDILWFSENTQEAGGEKNTGAVNAPWVVLNSAEQKSVGLTSCKIVNRNSFTLLSTTKYLASALSVMLFDVWCSTSTSNRIRLQLWIGPMRIGEVFVDHGEYNFNAYLINQWQTVSVPGSAFAGTGGFGDWQYDFVFIGNYKTGSTIYVDNVRMQQGLLPPTTNTLGHEHNDLNFLESLNQAKFDAKEDKTNKGIANGYAPLNSAIKIASTYLDIVNDLVNGTATNLLSGNQGVVLKSQIDAIYILLASDNINLDSIQEIVDAIETVQLSLSTILVNDLTTGGITKALTAEMGVTLKGLVDALTTAVALNTAKVSFPEAPSDTKTYGRKDEGWVEIVSGGALNKRLVANATGTYTLNHALGNDWKLTLTGATVIDESNLPTGTDTIEFTMKVTGNFGLTVPVYWTVLGDTYDGTIWNFFVVQIHKGDATQEATCFISNF